MSVNLVFRTVAPVKVNWLTPAHNKTQLIISINATFTLKDIKTTISSIRNKNVKEKKKKERT